MLLFTFSSLMNKIAGWFSASFNLLEYLNRNMNIVFILIAALGIIGWLIKQHQLNRKVEEWDTIK